MHPGYREQRCPDLLLGHAAWIGEDAPDLLGFPGNVLPRAYLVKIAGSTRRPPLAARFYTPQRLRYLTRRR
jgi:hypothetical protein